jgi:hypothetical protein
MRSDSSAYRHRARRLPRSPRRRQEVARKIARSRLDLRVRRARRQDIDFLAARIAIGTPVLIEP